MATDPTPATEATAPANTAAPTTGSLSPAAAAAMTVSGFKSMQDLQEKAPEVYNQMMIGIATNMISDMTKSQARIKQLNEYYRENT